MEEPYAINNGIYVIKNNENYLVVNKEGFRWAIIGKKDIAELNDFLQGNSKETELIQRLKKDRIIQDFETAYNLCETNRKKCLSLVVLHTTNQCSLNCDYCYANANSSKDNMSEITAFKTIDLIVQYKPKNRIKLEFHGGEPTLNSRLIFEAVEYSKKFRLDNGTALFSYSIQSNGFFFEDSLLDLFKRENFSIGISLDGPKEFHNSHRKKYSKEGSYDDVIKSISRLNERKMNFGTICVVTNPNVLDSYPDFMLERGLSSVKFNPYFKNQGRANWDSGMDIKAYATKMLDLTERVSRLNAKATKKLTISNISELIKNIISPKRDYMCMRFPCGAGISMLGIGVTGEVYPCEEMNGKEDLQIGNVHVNSLEEIFNHPVNRKITSRTLENLPECQACLTSDVCGINCANRSHSDTKAFYCKTPLCNYYKTIIPSLIWKIYENPAIIPCLT